MRYAKENSSPEIALQEVESVLQKHGMTIERSFNGLAVIYKGKEYRLRDVESGEGFGQLPRSLESERMQLVEDS